jgi:hypothetical protein
MISVLLLALAVVAAPQGVTPASSAQEETPPLTWKDLTKSGIPLRFYGFLRLDAYYNTARMNNIILPLTVSPENGTQADDDDAGFALDPRLTRFGMDVTPSKLGEVSIAGKLEIDFANFPTGSSESRATPRIRLAYIDVAKEALTLRVGQDWDLVSPLFPAVNNETLMWNAGNTGDRRAQIQGRWAPADSRFDVKASLGLTGAITNEDLDSGVVGLTPERDGFDSGLPHVQARAGLELDSPVEKKPIDLGAWGAIGKTETDSSFGGHKRFDVNIVGVDFQVPFTGSWSVRGEAWAGENLGDFRGGIGQSINKVTGDEISSVGGWAEVVYAATDKLRFHAGGTVDDPDDDEVPAPAGAAPGTVFSPDHNSAVYAGTMKDWRSGLRTGFDVIYWDTNWLGTEDGDGLRFNLYFQLNF